MNYVLLIFPLSVILLLFMIDNYYTSSSNIKDIQLGDEEDHYDAVYEEAQTQPAAEFAQCTVEIEEKDGQYNYLPSGKCLRASR